MKKHYTVIGLMSGTSLDGLDIACCRFEFVKDQWKYSIDCAETVPYSPAWKKRLSTVESQSAVDLALADTEYGHLCGQTAHNFIRRKKVKPDFIASHGHTVFHQPQKGMTFQIGLGAAIAAETGLPVVSDFRTSDVAAGGQGAPLVPIGDRLLFGQYTFCLNLGGFANISYELRHKRIAFDICPANIVLNYLAGKQGMEFDRDGGIASAGKLNLDLLSALDRLPYYSLKPPKSLGKEWVLSEFLPVLDRFRIPTRDKMYTVCNHIAFMVSAATLHHANGVILVTGGGAFNRFLIETIRMKTPHTICIPDDLTVSFKEALIFAFLGLLRMTGQPNALRSVTGARHDTIGGAIYEAIR